MHILRQRHMNTRCMMSHICQFWSACNVVYGACCRLIVASFNPRPIETCRFSCQHFNEYSYNVCCFRVGYHGCPCHVQVEPRVRHAVVGQLWTHVTKTDAHQPCGYVQSLRPTFMLACTASQGQHNTTSSPTNICQQPDTHYHMRIHKPCNSKRELT